MLRFALDRADEFLYRDDVPRVLRLDRPRSATLPLFLAKALLL